MKLKQRKYMLDVFLRSCWVGNGQKAGIASSHTGVYDRVLGTNVDSVDIKLKPMIKTIVNSNQCLVRKNSQFWLVTKSTQ
jgi:hypothetical protein